jgi:ABC-type multidrug transport system ATPase subunit
MAEEALMQHPPALDEDRGLRVTSPLGECPVVELTGIWRHWGRGRDRWAVLRDINLQLAGGTVTRISGRNGAGKTTLLRIVTGILAPDQGTVTIDGLTADSSRREYHRQLGFLSAGDRGLYARVSVRGHLDFAAAQAFVPRAIRQQAVADVVSSFELGELAGRRADRLSQGQRQRLRLALTVVHGPKVLLLDEPGNSLDAEGLAMLSAAVAAVRDRGGVVICCAPAGEEQSLSFDHTYVIEDGRLLPG